MEAQLSFSGRSTGSDVMGEEMGERTYEGAAGEGGCDV